MELKLVYEFTWRSSSLSALFWVAGQGGPQIIIGPLLGDLGDLGIAQWEWVDSGGP